MILNYITNYKVIDDPQKSYMVLSIIIPILSLVVGLTFENYILAMMMIGIEIIFSVLLVFENKKLMKD